MRQGLGGFFRREHDQAVFRRRADGILGISRGIGHRTDRQFHALGRFAHANEVPVQPNHVFARRLHHDQRVQVLRADVKRVRLALRDEHDFACARGQGLPFAIEHQFALQHVDGLVLPFMDVRRRLHAALGAGLHQGEATAGVLALGEKESVLPM